MSEGKQMTQVEFAAAVQTLLRATVSPAAAVRSSNALLRVQIGGLGVAYTMPPQRTTSTAWRVAADARAAYCNGRSGKASGKAFGETIAHAWRREGLMSAAEGYERATSAALKEIATAFGVAPEHPVMVRLRGSRDQQWRHAGCDPETKMPWATGDQ